MNAIEIADKSKINLKTVYALLDKLTQAGYVKPLLEITKRGRRKSSNYDSRAQKFYLEESWNSFQDNTESIPPPGYSLIEQGFRATWFQMVEKGEADEISLYILRFLEKIVERFLQSDKPIAKKWCPRLKDIDHSMLYCNGCGINHEARAFLRALLLCMLEHVENRQEYFKFLRVNNFLNEEGYNLLACNPPFTISNNITNKENESPTNENGNKYLLLKKITKLNKKKPVYYIGSKNPNKNKLSQGSNIIFFRLKNKSILLLGAGKIAKIELASIEVPKPQDINDVTNIAYISEYTILKNSIRLPKDLEIILKKNSQLTFKDSIIPISRQVFELIMVRMNQPKLN